MRKRDAENRCREAIVGKFGEMGRHLWNGNYLIARFTVHLCSSLSSSMVCQADTVYNATLQMIMNFSDAEAQTSTL